MQLPVVRHSTAHLAGFTGLSACVFCISLLISGIPLFETAIESQQPWNNTDFTGITPIRILVTLSYWGTIAGYLLWLKRDWTTSKPFAQILKTAAPFLAIATLAFPYSSDIFLYLQYGLMGLAGVNPYLTVSGEFSSILLPCVEWSQTSTYGPVSELIFMAAALGISLKPIVGVYLFKGFCLIAHCLNSYLIWRILKNQTHQSLLTIAYLLNPIILNEHVTNAHIDVFLGTATIGMIACLYNRQTVGALIFTILGIFTKTLPILWLPLLVGFFLHQRRFRALAIALGITISVCLVFSQTVFPNFLAWKSLLNPGVTGLTARSLYHWVNFGLERLGYVTLEARQPILGALKTGGTLVFLTMYAWVALRPWRLRSYPIEQLVADCGWVILWLLLLAMPWLMPWYPTILLAIAVLTPTAPKLLQTSHLFCLGAAFIVGAGSGTSPLSLVAVLFTLGGPLAALVGFPRLAFTQLPALQPDRVR